MKKSADQRIIRIIEILRTKDPKPKKVRNDKDKDNELDAGEEYIPPHKRKKR